MLRRASRLPLGALLGAAGGVGFGVGLSLCRASFWELERIDEMSAHPERFSRAEVISAAEASLREDFEESDVAMRWRAARAQYELALEGGVGWSERVSLLDSAAEALRKCRREDGHNAEVRRWLARVQLARAAHVGMLESVECYFEARGELEVALTLNPDDAEAWHLLGVVEEELSGWTWWYRSLLALWGAQAPPAALDTARDCFLRAEAVAPHSWKRNAQRVARVLEKMGLVEDAVRWAEVAVRECAVKRWDDVDAHVDALQLLQKHDPQRFQAILRDEGVEDTAGNVEEAERKRMARKFHLKPPVESLDPEEQKQLRALNKEEETRAQQAKDAEKKGIKGIWSALRDDQASKADHLSRGIVAGVGERR